jgi:uncharacterized membrane protein (DUF2068 family)
VKRSNKHENRDKWETAIAVLKLFKATLFIALAFGALSLVHRDAQEVLAHRVDQIGVDPENHLIEKLLEYAGYASPKKIAEFSLGFFLYGVLFGIEGIGLLMMKPWARWFTAIITASFIPWEVYAFSQHADTLKAITILLNIATVVYLIFRIRHSVPQKSIMA